MKARKQEVGISYFIGKPSIQYVHQGKSLNFTVPIRLNCQLM